METFMLGIFTILTSDFILHLFGLCFAVASGLLLYYACHTE